MHTKSKTIGEGDNTLKPKMIYHILVYVTAFFAHFHHAMTVPVWPDKEKKIPPFNGEEELMMETWCLLKKEEKGDFSPAHLTFDYKTITY